MSLPRSENPRANAKPGPQKTCLAKGTESGPRIVRKVAILEFVTSIAISKKVS